MKIKTAHYFIFLSPKIDVSCAGSSRTINLDTIYYLHYGDCSGTIGTALLQVFLQRSDCLCKHRSKHHFFYIGGDSIDSPSF